MTFDLRELYQEVILDHNRKPRNKGAVDEATSSAEGHNPLCGDNVRLTLRCDNGVVTEIAFDGQGCAISTASASLMTEAVKGKTIEEAEALFRTFQALVTGNEPLLEDDALGSLNALAGVRDHPVRIKCATLPWHTLHAALSGEKDKVSTE
jgi:nitrogen fixation protein NifU and related proteins